MEKRDGSDRPHGEAAVQAVCSGAGDQHSSPYMQNNIQFTEMMLCEEGKNTMREKIMYFLYEWLIPIMSGIVGGIIGTAIFKLLVH